MTGKSKKAAEAPEAPPAAAPSASNASVIASAAAPFIYLDGAPAAGHLNGVNQVTLDATQLIPAPGESRAHTDEVIVAHLRMDVPAARHLIATLQAVVAIAERHGR